MKRSYKEEYQYWLDSPALGEEEWKELSAIAGDDKEIESRFYAPLEFGTAGLRGIMATGLNRMNIHVIRHATQAFAQGVLEVGPNSINPHGKVHGGALATLADTVGGCCACSKGGLCVTSSSTMEFLRPADGPRIFCTATPKKMGYHLSVIQVELTNVSGETVATGTFTFFMSHS